MISIATLLLLILASTSTSATTCTAPTPTTYTTTDASVLSSIAYISTFPLTCTPPLPPGQNLYAVQESPEGGQVIIPLGLVHHGDQVEYQISLVKEVASSSSGDHTFSIYGEEGLSLLKKKQAVTPLAVVLLNHPGAYNGPWLNSEHLAAILGVLVGWAAISGKGRLLA